MQPAISCVGARQLGMGGAFIGLADDADATYWNPAGLAFLEKKEVKGMLILSDEINYKSNLSYAQPAGEKYAVGVNIIGYNKFVDGADDSMQQFLIQGSVAYRISDKIAVGANIKKHSTRFSISDNTIKTDGGIGIDISFLQKINDKTSWGILIQDVNEPTEKVEGQDLIKWVRNVRPGIAYHASDKLVLTADVYDLFNASNQDVSFCLGGEYKLNDGKYTVRGGVYRLGAEDGSLVSVGASAKISDAFTVDAALLDGKAIIGGSYSF